MKNSSAIKTPLRPEREYLHRHKIYSAGNMYPEGHDWEQFCSVRTKGTDWAWGGNFKYDHFPFDVQLFFKSESNRGPVAYKQQLF